MTHERPQPIDVNALKEAIDLVDFAQRYIHLQPVSRAGEYAGPCPRCGGEDRFRVLGQRFFCRQCTPRGGDVIDLVRMLHNLTFVEACRYLRDELPLFSERPPAPPSAPTPDSARESSNAFTRSARKTLYAVERNLFAPSGEAGRAYLHARGLMPAIWRTFRLGFGQTYHPGRRRNEAAIFIPWFSRDGAQLQAIRHRFIAADLSKGERYCLRAGSRPLVFGLQALRAAPALVIVEGEFNCMALHQCGVMALSLGSETGARQTASLTRLHDLADLYPRIDVWFDNLAQGEALWARMHQAEPFREKEGQVLAPDHDANALLARGELRAFLYDHGLSPTD